MPWPRATTCESRVRVRATACRCGASGFRDRGAEIRLVETLLAPRAGLRVEGDQALLSHVDLPDAQGMSSGARSVTASHPHPAVWFPTVRAGTGSDVFTERLVQGLAERGVRAEITWLPLR